MKYQWVQYENWPAQVTGKEVEQHWQPSYKEWTKSRSGVLFVPYVEARFHSRGVTLLASNETTANLCTELLRHFAKTLARLMLTSLAVFKSANLKVRVKEMTSIVGSPQRSLSGISAWIKVRILAPHDMVTEDLRAALPGADIIPHDYQDHFPTFRVKNTQESDLLRLQLEGVSVLQAQAKVYVLDSHGAAFERPKWTRPKVDKVTQTHLDTTTTASHTVQAKPAPTPEASTSTST
jgi:hypothetical protein